ncbi:tRNA (adenosine(37)-N6)-threonylcarbamoyltransferase complex transferase subunit TsaD [Buchnera aphidicola]|uniref:tRNA N6-adenosine threonylcarbamoyltransferase n=1 Tax=Buchnera aphidicola subsp. Cinara cedri (strain Cc) TaxID=372461 RepID=TSAD_BUCCC|nr:tRNA (adenosine(37)-N6)-threonylcarbamoyltransferase complex transferase subunit TsaD [Buchnera aphidicola]Q058D1.1 RecName: Full=tRNA N6-adenosine threonylcarbamoyltransferase; AltName: Full=N6-L-threonylcarbamoyladenine synthase; Short=t(6)A synthase; AltName: Full=t(6)A37 threonylcarbamoyladenosine biosynthesis protein TsaD; AltName: Full=tRNA threonylcarbamoyladenosine biosynthesis protein TsaD [Buchnera aphidicola BCc]ABJ90518.1 putative O-sialoglycoprotein endopeptidase [Buchnera aphidic
MKILGIETSCDDTSVAIYDKKLGLIDHQTLNQNSVHSKYHGIVPELAARSHLNQLNFLIKNIFSKYFLYNSSNFKKKFFKAVAYTVGPGLSGSIVVHSCRSIALSLDIPYILINHLEGHLLSVMLSYKKNLFPFLALLVSGANTQLIYAKYLGKYIILGQTLDDAVGNVFDYIAKILGLGFPGGKNLSDLAKYGISGKYFFPRPMTKYSNLNFSFSGLKTHVKNVILNSSDSFQEKSNIAKSFEEAIVDTLIIKCKLAIKKIKVKNFLVCGGVSSNRLLRIKLKKLIYKNQRKLYFSKKKFCTDNAGMIAYLGFLKYQQGMYSYNKSFSIYPNLLISDNINYL